jgi:hypothetical protein
MNIIQAKLSENVRNLAGVRNKGILRYLKSGVPGGQQLPKCGVLGSQQVP